MKLEECFDQYFIWKNRLLTPSSTCTCYVGGRKRAEGPCMVGTGFSKALLLSDFFLQVPRLWEGAPISSRPMMLIREVLLFLQCCWPPLLLHWMLHPMWGFIQVMEEPFFSPSLARVHFSGLVQDWVLKAASTPAEKYFANCSWRPNKISLAAKYTCFRGKVQKCMVANKFRLFVFCI